MDQQYEKGADGRDTISRSDGEIQDAPQDANELKRGFKPRHVNMFAIAGSIGTGLIIGSGSALAAGGPGSIFIAYLLMGTCVFFVMTAFAEMAVFVPMRKGFSGYATRFVDPALGFATGWNYFFKYIILTANNLTACGLIIGYWRPDLNVGIWVAVFGLIVIALNMLPVNWFGETEFWMAVLKVLVLTGLILLCFIIALGGSPSGHRTGFHYWNDPGAFAQFLLSGNLGRFLGFWNCVCQAAFMFMGTEVVGITFSEAKNPSKTIPRAIKQTIARIGFFYVFGILVLGMCVPYTDELLLDATKAKTSAAASPFVIAIQRARIKTLPSIVNGCLLIFTISFANSDIYIASRALYALAKDHQAPAIFTRTKNGVPVYAVGFASLFICLAFLNVSTSSATVFGYFVSLSTVLGLVNWVNIMVTYFFFQRALQRNGFTRADLPYRGPLQPYGTYAAFLITGIVIIFQGYKAFITSFDHITFVVSYIGLVAYLLNITAWKFWKRTKRVKFEDADFGSEGREQSVEYRSIRKHSVFKRMAGFFWGA